MTRKEACRILGIQENCTEIQVKKRYRQLLHLVHPDAAVFRSQREKKQERQQSQRVEEYPFGIHEIQAAYLLLLSRDAETPVAASTDARAGSRKKEEDEDAWMRRDPEYARAVWDAPENSKAYCEREILQEIEDPDGGILGTFTLIRGKYLWIPEEEFHLFLRSISRAVGKLLQDTEEKAERQAFGPDQDPWDFDSYASAEEIRESRKIILTGKLTYLLAQQFIDAAGTLEQLVQTRRNKEDTETFYCIPSRLEGTGGTAEIEPGEILLPSRTEHHRLYVKNKGGDEVGYLSFPDDRMYYLVVPLFEQRRVQVKIIADQKREESQVGRFRKRGSNQIRIRLWLRFKDTAGGCPENLSAEIHGLLEEYREALMTFYTS